MRIIIDGDACPAKDKIKPLAIKHKLEVLVYVDSSHVFEDDYFKIIIVSQGKDAVDMKIVNSIENNDLLITQDYGLASLTLYKCKYVVNPLGYLYTVDNIDQLLMQRHISQKNRRAGKRGPTHKKRTLEDDNTLIDLLDRLMQESLLGSN